MVFGQVQTSLNFYFYGKKHFTKTGYEKNVKSYEEPNLLDEVDLTNQVFMITGSNTGIGKEIALYVAKKGARVFMICRSPDRAIAARDDIIQQSNNQNVIFLQADISLEADVRRVWNEFINHPLAKVDSNSDGEGKVQLHGLVCNAGALLNTLTMTSEGLETTFAAHLLFGTYLLGDLAMPILQTSSSSLSSSTGSRMIIVSSGGMYNYALPSWEVLTSTNESSETNYNGNKAYAYAKRAQVILAEKWALQYPNVKIVTAHPGWSASEGVDAAYGENKSWLEPMRSCWEGAEGICWLLACKKDKIQSGEFYMDRKPQPKHIAGAFWYEGSATKNTIDDVDMMMLNLKRWGAADSDNENTTLWRPTIQRTQEKFVSRRTNPEAIPTIVSSATSKFRDAVGFFALSVFFTTRNFLLTNFFLFQHLIYNTQQFIISIYFYAWTRTLTLTLT